MFVRLNTKTFLNKPKKLPPGMKPRDPIPRIKSFVSPLTEIISPIAPITIAVVKNTDETFRNYIGPCLESLPKGSYHLIIDGPTQHPAELYNTIIERSPTDYIMFLHADITFNRSFIRELTNSIESEPKFGAMGLYGAAQKPNGGKIVYKANSSKQYEVETLDSCSILINKSQGIKFDSCTFDNFHFYVDDYCCQARNKGLKVFTLVVEGMEHHSSTLRVLGSDWGRCSEYKAKLHKKWNRYVPTTAGEGRKGLKSYSSEGEKTSIVIVAFNNVELVRRTVESANKYTYGDNEIIIVDNHSLDDRTRKYIYESKYRVLDPGENIGCHRGFSYGFEQCSGDYLVKLDDDSVILTPDWNSVLIETLKEWNDKKEKPCSFIAPHSDCRHASKTETIVLGTGRRFDIIKSGNLGFSCVMIPKNVYEKFGPLYNIKSNNTSLYGGEESYYAKKATDEGYVYGYAMDAMIHHLDNEERDVDYVLWKYAYGYLGSTKLQLAEFKKDKKSLIEGYTHWIGLKNEWLRQKGMENLKRLEG